MAPSAGAILLTCLALACDPAVARAGTGARGTTSTATRRVDHGHLGQDGVIGPVTAQHGSVTTGAAAYHHTRSQGGPVHAPPHATGSARRRRPARQGVSTPRHPRRASHAATTPTTLAPQWPRRPRRPASRFPPPPDQPSPLRRLVLLAPDVSTIGGVATQTLTIVQHARTHRQPRVDGVEVVALTRYNARNLTGPGLLSYETEPAAVEDALFASWSPNDTAILVPTDALHGTYPQPLLDRLAAFPLVYVGTGQMAYLLQHTTVFCDRPWADAFNVSAIIAFSEGDIAFQQQMGVHGQVLSFPPVDQRPLNTFDPAVNTRVGYVGRFQFPIKGTDRLLDVAAELKARSLARATPLDPLVIYATVGPGAHSPNHAAFLDLVRARNLTDAVHIVENCRDKDAMYGRLRVMLVPSRKESASYAALEAMSYGVPVIAASYAPGPAQLITHGQTGFLVDEWTGAAVVDRVEDLTGDRLAAMSRAAFQEHARHSIDDFMDVLQRVAKQALALHAAAGGRNVVRPFPDMGRLGRKGC